MRRTILSHRSAGVVALLWGAAVAVDHNHASVLVASAKQEVLQPDSDVLKGAVDEKAVAMANQAAVVYDSDGIAAVASGSGIVSAGSATGPAPAGTRRHPPPEPRARSSCNGNAPQRGLATVSQR